VTQLEQAVRDAGLSIIETGLYPAKRQSLFIAAQKCTPSARSAGERSRNASENNGNGSARGVREVHALAAVDVAVRRNHRVNLA
jgi:hypothetical protein